MTPETRTVAVEILDRVRAAILADDAPSASALALFLADLEDFAETRSSLTDPFAKGIGNEAETYAALVERGWIVARQGTGAMPAAMRPLLRRYPSAALRHFPDFIAAREIPGSGAGAGVEVVFLDAKFTAPWKKAINCSQPSWRCLARLSAVFRVPAYLVDVRRSLAVPVTSETPPPGTEPGEGPRPTDLPYWAIPTSAAVPIDAAFGPRKVFRRKGAA